MRILVLSQAAWDNRNSFGNTAENFFDGEAWSGDAFAHFYARAAAPNTSIADVYYQVSATDVVKEFFGKRRTHTFTAAQVADRQEMFAVGQAEEQKSIAYIHKTRNEFLYWGMEQIWRSRAWFGKECKQFLEDFQPEILFAFATDVCVLAPMMEYVRRRFGCKTVLFIADDVLYSMKRYIVPRRVYLLPRLKKCLCSADLIYGASEEICEKYADAYGITVKPLYKGCDLSQPPAGNKAGPIRLAYAGNLLYGRTDTLCAVADAVQAYNRTHEGSEAVLEVYTGTEVSSDMREKLERGGAARIMGQRPYAEIKQILHDADIVLHVESFSAQQREVVRYSLSTKIIDCLQSGSAILGIGPSEVASIRYLERVDGAVTVSEPGKIPDVITQMLQSREALGTLAERSRAYAKAHHELRSTREKLHTDFTGLLHGCRNPE